jgi:hypothetical protein
MEKENPNLWAYMVLFSLILCTGPAPVQKKNSLWNMSTYTMVYDFDSIEI